MNVFLNKSREEKIKIKKLIINKKNLGAAMSRNIASKYIRGEFTAFIDADDIWKKNKLEYQTRFMKKNNFDLSFTFYDIFQINTKTKKVKKIYFLFGPYLFFY